MTLQADQNIVQAVGADRAERSLTSKDGLSMIVAVADNGAIGKGNELPWRLSADLRYFKQRTMGKPIVMGRKTWESIGRPLPGRDNIVISRDTQFSADGARVVSSLDQAVEACKDAAEIMIIGGAMIYEQALPLVSRLYLTRVHVTVNDADAFFELPEKDSWRVTCNHFLQGENKEPDCTFQVLERIHA